MLEYKCRICGEKIKPVSGVVKCTHCNTRHAFPVLNNEQLEKLYASAMKHYLKNEFDQACSIFELMISEGNADAAVYWDLVLCKYGIQYVFEPKKNQYVPTLFKRTFAPIFEEENYNAAMECASDEQKILFTQEANVIRDIQTEAASLSKTIECDVFISYKQTGENGEPTVDSQRARVLYEELTKERYKVFYAPESLKEKAGYYEPIIYSALHKAKFMVVIGTKPEYFNAPWVKNEWSRYLPICQEGKGVLIPAYENMRPEDIPHELRAGQQAFPIDPVESFTSRAIRTIKSVQEEDEIPPLLKAALDALIIGEKDEAEELCKGELQKKNPNIGMVYMIRLMIAMNVKTPEELGKCEKPIKGHKCYKMSYRSANKRLKRQLETYNKEIEDRIENEKKTKTYNEAIQLMTTAKTEEEFLKAAEKFKEVLGFKEASKLHAECLKKAEESRKEPIYQSAVMLMGKNTIEGYNEAIKVFKTIPGFEGSLGKSEDCIENCEKAIAQLKADTYAKARSELLVATTSKQYESASTLLEAIKEYEDAEYLARYSRKVANETSRFEALVDMIDNMYRGNVEGYDAAVKRLETVVQWSGPEPVALFREWTLGQRKKKQPKKGDVVKFGSYWQDSEGKTKNSIEWIVLAQEADGTLLLISRYALDGKPYNTEKKPITWEGCSLRQWLNSDFLNTAFTEEEKGMIRVTQLKNEDNPEYGTKGGSATKDRVFLLSIEEAQRYFPNNEARQCIPTPYAIANGAYVTDDVKTCCWWWLRSPGNRSINAAIVNYGGSLSFYGSWVFSSDGAVRPSLRIHPESPNPPILNLPQGVGGKSSKTRPCIRRNIVANQERVT